MWGVFSRSESRSVCKTTISGASLDAVISALQKRLLKKEISSAGVKELITQIKSLLERAEQIVQEDLTYPGFWGVVKSVIFPRAKSDAFSLLVMLSLLETQLTFKNGDCPAIQAHLREISANAVKAVNECLKL